MTRNGSPSSGNDRVGGIRIEPIGKPIDIGMVAVAERRIACGNHRIEAALAHFRADERVAPLILHSGEAGKYGSWKGHPLTPALHGVRTRMPSSASCTHHPLLFAGPEQHPALDHAQGLVCLL